MAALPDASSAHSNLTQDAVKKIVTSALNRIVGAPVTPGQRVSVAQVQQIAQKVLDSLGLGSVVPFQVERNPAAAGIPVPQGIVPTGGASNGKVYAFSDNIANEAEAFKVIFHELLHLGLSQSVNPRQSGVQPGITISDLQWT